jgi:putative SOS response-associated peptidase YedK
MCNLYSMTTNVEAIRRMFQVDAANDKSGNLPAMPGIYPDYPAPIVRNGAGGRELAMVRWGMPSSQKALMDATTKRAEKLQAKGKTVDFKELLRLEPDSGTTNIRNVSSAHWKRWLGPESRCLVPFTSFSEYDTIDGKKNACLVCGGGEQATAVLCRLVDELDQCAKGEGRRDQGRYLRFSDYRAEYGSWTGAPEGNAGDS